MSRSGYIETDDCDDMRQMALWRGQVASATRGKRGQRLFRDLLAALDAMPAKRLIAHELVTPGGEVCALGALGKVRGINLDDIDAEDPTEVAEAFNVAEQLAREVVYYNDEVWDHDISPEERWKRMRAWVASQVKGE